MNKLITTIYSTCYQLNNPSKSDKTIGIALLVALIIIAAGTLMIAQKLN